MKILLIEEELLLAVSIKSLLVTKGFGVDIVYDGKSGIESAMQGIYDLLIVDVAVPGMDNCKVVKTVREKHTSLPIMMLASEADMENRIAGLTAGADYYLSKPFDSRELMACINSIFRRQNSQTDILEFGNTRLDLATCMLICGEKSIRLSSREYDMMRFLLQSQDRVIPKEMILAHVWGMESNAVDNHVEVYAGFLRKKLASIGSNFRITAIRRLGYYLEMVE